MSELGTRKSLVVLWHERLKILGLCVSMSEYNLDWNSTFPSPVRAQGLDVPVWVGRTLEAVRSPYVCPREGDKASTAPKGMGRGQDSHSKTLQGARLPLLLVYSSWEARENSIRCCPLLAKLGTILYLSNYDIALLFWCSSWDIQVEFLTSLLWVTWGTR